MVGTFQHIGSILEVSAKHNVQELYALICLFCGKNVDYEKIRKQDFGVVINNILSIGMFDSILKVEPYGMKLSDWRNISYHHTYSINEDGTVLCKYGKEYPKSIQMPMEELEQCAHKIT